MTAHAMAPCPVALELLAVHGPLLVQDGGRAGRMHEGLPPGGALVPELLARANAAARNGPAAAALEAYGGLTLAARGGAALLGVDGRAVALRPDEPLTIPPPDAARVRYVAVRGGVDAPCVLGGRGTLLVAALGGLGGRPLRRGDRVPVGALPPATPAREDTRAPPLDLASPVRVVLGPDLPRFTDAALGALLGAEFTVTAASDRVGARLAGPALARRDDDRALSTPMVRGAIQVPAGGGAIVLGPDHPTTGGYPVIAAVIRADLGRLFARRPGATVRFRAVSLAEARAAWQAARASSSAGP